MTGNDRALRGLPQYTAHHADLKLVGCLDARDKKCCVLVKSLDGDFAGDLENTTSSSGLWIVMQSADGKRCWPIAWRSKRQSSTASTICEIPGHPWDEKGLQRQISNGTLVSSKERRAFAVALMKR